MSPHILIDEALEGFSDPSSKTDCDITVQRLITKLFTDGAITADEFNHYCKRLMIAQWRKEAA
ncbi:hypothetical protein PF66_06232 [Pseudomonas asplenii]|uniref:Uncharacterized protein n=1 Tax=Pseudomonas asplenii TaxID=53407 RepID=A0A0M9GBX9_9PSED|nr:hypothetical protein [Pseudomonas fuscovaginae]KPA87322.1 hypothetical protein PF66_06232 [Pseudomonas fuscovaginae]